MNTSERIKLITQISKKLVVEEWDIIDLTLDQFGLPTFTSWNGEKVTYIIEAIKEAENQVIVSLATHLGIISRPETTREIVSSHWRMNTFKIFLSHISAYKD